MMTKKDFIALADEIRKCPEEFSQVQLESIANVCRRVNGNFRREQWLDYIAGKCGPSGGKISRPKWNQELYEGK